MGQNFIRVKLFNTMGLRKKVVSILWSGQRGRGKRQSTAAYCVGSRLARAARLAPPVLARSTPGGGVQQLGVGGAQRPEIGRSAATAALPPGGTILGVGKLP